MTDDNPTTAVDEDDKPLTWRDLGMYDPRDVVTATEFLEGYLEQYFKRTKKGVKVGLLTRH